ncbi:2Fe-2S iron-sulfur cluster-binding protein [Streptomyces sp. NPDC001793]|uniref:2Fe-2S iron-sulfur cluster-binding protein n=1 Tax=Streptomyces sp. NPDC001793 TaxID=3154657 RepID=UPI00332FF9A7
MSGITHRRRSEHVRKAWGGTPPPAGAGLPDVRGPRGGARIRTAESLAPGPPDCTQLADLQRVLWKHHALPCGFCTPGFLMLAEGFLAERPDAV